MCKILIIYDTSDLFAIKKQDINTRVFERLKLALFLYLYLLNHSAEITIFIF